MSQFKVGDQVEYLPAPNKYYVIVKSVSTNMLTCSFASLNDHSYTYGEHTFDKQVFSPVNTMFKEERVAAKCKLLWNNSKYVKLNPKAAY